MLQNVSAYLFKDNVENSELGAIQPDLHEYLTPEPPVPHIFGFTFFISTLSTPF